MRAQQGKAALLLAILLGEYLAENKYSIHGYYAASPNMPTFRK
jgi:hypothetical protein